MELNYQQDKLYSTYNLSIARYYFIINDKIATDLFVSLVIDIKQFNSSTGIIKVHIFVGDNSFQ